MTADAQSMPKSKEGPPKRRFRNFLLDARFQLKYTGMVVAVTVFVTGSVGLWLGTEAYNYSRGMSQMLLMQQEGAMQVDDELHALMAQEAAEEDAKIFRQIVIGIVALVLILSLALGFTGIIVTHKVVGPAYKLRLMLGDVAAGTLNIRGGFRKGDELQEVGEAFKDMVKSLKTRRAEELAQLDEAIAAAKESSADEAVLEQLTALRDRLQATLEG